MPKNRHQTYSDHQSQAALAKKLAEKSAPKKLAAKKKTAQPRSS